MDMTSHRPPPATGRPAPAASAAQRRQVRLIAAACRQIEQAVEPPDLGALAREAGLSRFHFHRLFKQLTGITPKAYASAQRARRAQEALARGVGVTAALYASGYASSSPFYAAAARDLGMRPADYRAGGRGTTIRFAVASCSLGALLVAATSRGICAILLGDEPEALVRDLQDRFAHAELIGADPQFEQWVAQVVGLIESPHQDPALPLDLRGTAFQKRVWAALRRVPAGTTISYAALAQRLGMPRAARAVAQACAANPVAVAVPCHRVVRTDGAVSGYRWGVARKLKLLAREQARGDATPGSKRRQEKSKSRSSGTGTS